MSLKNEPVSVEIESCAPSHEQGTTVGLFIIRSPYDNVGLVIMRLPYDNYGWGDGLSSPVCRGTYVSITIIELMIPPGTE